MEQTIGRSHQDSNFHQPRPCCRRDHRGTVTCRHGGNRYKGDAGGGAPVLGSAVVPPGVAQSFTVNETLTDARIGLEMFCLPRCDVTLYLINGLPGRGLACRNWKPAAIFPARAVSPMIWCPEGLAGTA